VDAHIKELALAMGVEPYSFNPYEDANDCNALIKHLNGLGISVELHLDNNGYVVVFGYKNPDPFFNYEGDNWMHGVCELALKVIEQGENDG